MTYRRIQGGEVELHSLLKPGTILWWPVSFTAWSLYSQRKNSGGWAPEPVWTFQKRGKSPTRRPMLQRNRSILC